MVDCYLFRWMHISSFTSVEQLFSATNKYDCQCDAGSFMFCFANCEMAAAFVIVYMMKHCVVGGMDLQDFPLTIIEAFLKDQNFKSVWDTYLFVCIFPIVDFSFPWSASVVDPVDEYLCHNVESFLSLFVAKGLRWTVCEPTCPVILKMVRA